MVWIAPKRIPACPHAQPMAPCLPSPVPAHDADTADLMTAVVHIWIALAAVQGTVPASAAQIVSVATTRVSEVLGRILKRHGLTEKDFT